MEVIKNTLNIGQVVRLVVHSIIVMGGLIALSGCAGSPIAEPNVEQVTAAESVAGIEVATTKDDSKLPQRPKPEDYPVAPFEGDSLYELLVAEVAGARSRNDLALEKYIVVAERTRDPGVAARATLLALYMKETDVALRAAMVWADEDPEDIEARRHVSDLLLNAGRLDEAIVHMEAIKQLGGMANFDIFAYRASGLSKPQRQSLLVAIETMLERHPFDESLLFSKAVLLERDGQLEEALVLTEQLLATSSNVNVVILKTSILNALRRLDEARSFLADKVVAFPDNRRLRLILARLLFEQGALEAAKVEYTLVLEKSQNDGDALFALALIALELGNDVEARRLFEKMVRWDRRPGEAHYYLGGISERESDATSAIQEYKQAGDGYEFIPAQARIASLLVDDGRWDEARSYLAKMRAEHPTLAQQLVMIEAQLLAERGMEQEVFEFLDAVLLAQPENVELLYFRAMTGQKFERLDILEADLRSVIALDPANADALNALGYTLADQTVRFAEALELIEMALAIKPDEAAFIDSMGWVQYRLGNFDEAVKHLRRALLLFQNDEVAAHLGEVLWAMENHAEANLIWQQALDLKPDSEILKVVIERLRPE